MLIKVFLLLAIILNSSCSTDSWWGLEGRKEILKGERKLMFGSKDFVSKQLHNIELKSGNNITFDKIQEFYFDDSISSDNQVVVTNNNIYFIDRNNNLVALDILSKQKLWDNIIGDKNKSSLSKLSYSHDFIFSVNEEGILQSYKNTGEQLWQINLEYPVNQLEVNNKYNVLCLTHLNFNINCVDFKGNKIVMFDDHTSDITVTSKFVPVIDNNVLYYSNKNGTIRAFDIFKGAEIWRLNISEKFDSSYASFYNLVTRPVFDSHNIYIANYIGGISALSKHDGKEVWFLPVRSTEILKKYNDYILTTNGDNKFIIIHASNGEVVFFKELFNVKDKIKIIDMFANGNNQVILISKSGKIYKFDIAADKIDTIYDFRDEILGAKQENSHILIITKNKVYKVPLLL